MRILLKKLFILLLCSVIASLSSGQEGSKIKTVVIDAGHGGKDPGALGKHSKEKDIALAVALKTGAYIEKNLDVEVIYTRKDDRFIPLHKRADIANKANADFFLSIHCNAIESGNASGAETYIMGLHKNDENLNVAMKENAAILLEENADDEYAGFDANSVESYIQFNLLQDENLDQSSALAENIQKQFKDRVGRRDRGVYQAGFLVLWRTAMPGVLIELGYISNPEEEKFLTSENGQVYMASAIYRAFRDYKKEYEKENVQPKAIVQKKEEPKPVIVEQPEAETIKETKHEKAVDIKEQISGLNYRIQFYTSPKKLVSNDKRIDGVVDLKVYFHNGIYKYTSGQFKSISEAKNQLSKLKELGYGDAFIVPFDGDERIGFEQARQMERGN